MKKQEAGVWSGGMLADEMGMGKTIQTLGLFVNDRRKPNLVVAYVFLFYPTLTITDDNLTVRPWLSCSGGMRSNSIRPDSASISSMGLLARKRSMT